jgi:hypothetical protein
MAGPGAFITSDTVQQTPPKLEQQASLVGNTWSKNSNALDVLKTNPQSSSPDCLPPDPFGDIDSQLRKLKARCSEMATRACSSALHGLALTDNTTLIADNSAKQEARGERQKQKDASDVESAELVELHKTVGAIRDSGILTAPGRTGEGNTEYKLAIFKDGTHTKAYPNHFVGTDPLTHSDVYAQDSVITKEIVINTAMLNPLAKLVHSHPNKKGMDPYIFSKEDIVESNSANADSILIGPDGRVFIHKANFDGKYMNTANITDEMRIPDRVLGKFDKEGKFHQAKYHGTNVEFETEGF